MISNDRASLFDTVKRTLKHSLIYGLFTILTTFTGFVLLPFYTKYLSPAEYGVFALIGILSTALAFLYDLGMVNALVRWCFEYSDDQLDQRKTVVFTALIFLLITSSIFTILFLVYSPKVSILLFHDTKFSNFIKLMVIATFFNCLAWVPLSLFRVKEKSFTFVFATACKTLGLICLIILFLAVLKRGLGGVYESNLIISIIFTGPLFLLTFKEYTIKFSMKDLFGMLKFGVPFIPVLFFSWIIDFSDRYFLGQLSTLSEVGLYSVGYKIGQIVFLVVKTFAIAWIPIMFTVSRKENAAEIFAKILTYYILFIFLFALSISIFGRGIITIFTSSAYHDAYKVVPLISISYFFYGIYVFALSGLLIVKNVYVQPLLLSFSAILNVFLNILLIPKYGMMGAAYATLLSYLSVAAGTYYFSQKYYPIHIEVDRILKIVFCGVVIYTVSLFVPDANLAHSIIIKLLILSFYPLSLYLIKFFRQEEVVKLKAAIMGKA